MAEDTNNHLNVTKRIISLITEAMDLSDAYGIAPEATASLAIAQQQFRDLLAKRYPEARL